MAYLSHDYDRFFLLPLYTLHETTGLGTPSAGLSPHLRDTSLPIGAEGGLTTSRPTTVGGDGSVLLVRTTPGTRGWKLTPLFWGLVRWTRTVEDVVLESTVEEVPSSLPCPSPTPRPTPRTEDVMETTTVLDRRHHRGPRRPKPEASFPRGGRSYLTSCPRRQSHHPLNMPGAHSDPTP